VQSHPGACDKQLRMHPDLSRLSESFKTFSRSSSHSRAHLLRSIAEQIEQERDSWAKLICQEVHKPITLAELEVTRAIQVFRWAAEETTRDSGSLIRLDAMPTGRAGMGISRRFPRGVVLGITPFNFPLNLVAHKIAPALATGSPILIKPSPYASQTASKLCTLIGELEPKLPLSVCVSPPFSDEQSKALTLAPEIATLSFTGSSAVGWKIREQSPKKPITLELGGTAWVIIGEDTPLDQAPSIAKKIARAAFGYAGQSCISVQNIALPKTHAQDWMAALIQTTQVLPYGDPLHREVICGPVIHEAAAQRIRSAIQGYPVLASSQNQLGRVPPKLENQLLTPLLLGLHADQAPPEEEIFGPVAWVSDYSSIPELIARINGGKYGIHCGAFTDHWPTISQLYEELEVGGLLINDVPTTRYDHQPYGGVKESGIGREGIRSAMDEMTDVKFLAL